MQVMIANSQLSVLWIREREADSPKINGDPISVVLLHIETIFGKISLASSANTQIGRYRLMEGKLGHDLEPS